LILVKYSKVISKKINGLFWIATIISARLWEYLIAINIPNEYSQSPDFARIRIKRCRRRTGKFKSLAGFGR
jgi:hypothetical protein